MWARRLVQYGRILLWLAAGAGPLHAAEPPVITEAVPSIVEAGSIVTVVVHGSGLQDGVLTTDHPEITVRAVQPSEVGLEAELVIQNPTRFGRTRLAVTTLDGTAFTVITILQPSPRLERVRPETVLAGEVVILEGAGFATRPEAMVVVFAGVGGERLEGAIQAEPPPTPTLLAVQVPPGAQTGPVHVEVGTVVSTPFLLAVQPFMIKALAQEGTPADFAIPSANAGQVVTIRGAGLTSSRSVTFPTMSATGERARLTVSPTRGDPAGRTLMAVVPVDAVTGMVEVAGLGRMPLQIVPLVQQVVPTAVEAGRPTLVTLQGMGLREAQVVGEGLMIQQVVVKPSGIEVTVEGVNPPPQPVGRLVVETAGGRTAIELAVRQPEPVLESLRQTVVLPGDRLDVVGRYFGTDPGRTVVVFTGPGGRLLAVPVATTSTPSRLVVEVPAGAVSGLVRVRVGRVESAPGPALTLQGMRLEAVAAQGEPLDLHQASANGGQEIMVVSHALPSDVMVTFPVVDATGQQGRLTVQPTHRDATGRALTVVVPPQAVTGMVEVVGLGRMPLQIVPLVTEVVPTEVEVGGAAELSLSGTGLSLARVVDELAGVTVQRVERRPTLLRLRLGLPNPPLTERLQLSVETAGGRTVVELTVRQPEPVVEALRPPTVLPGDRLEVVGRHFGTRPDTTSVLFPGLGDLVLEVPLAPTSIQTPSRLVVEVPAGAMSGPVRVRVGQMESAPGPVLTLQEMRIEAVAVQGEPADPTQPSANGGQPLLVRGEGLTSATTIRFPVLDEQGDPDALELMPASVEPGGLTMTVVVPPQAVTGKMEVAGLGRTRLQIVPLVTEVVPTGVEVGGAAELTFRGTGLGRARVTTEAAGVTIQRLESRHDRLRLRLGLPNPPLAKRLQLSVETAGGRTVVELTVRQPEPVVEALRPPTVLPGDRLEVVGRHFGTRPDTAVVLFPGPNGQLLEVPVGVIQTPTRLVIQVPMTAVVGTLMVRVGELHSAAVPFTIKPVGIMAQAVSGQAIEATLASANVGQTITIRGGGLATNIPVTFPTVDDAGVRGTITVIPSTVDLERGSLTVEVPAQAVTGLVQIGAVGSDWLQLVPTLTLIEVTSFVPGAPIVLVGTGFEEGAMSVQFSQIVIEDRSPTEGPDVFDSNQRLRLVIPGGAGSTLTVRGPGGAVTWPRPIGPTRFTGIEAAAATGMPADPAVSSANVGQAIRINGENFWMSTVVRFASLTSAGVEGMREVPVRRVALDGSWAEVVVPQETVTGSVVVVGVVGDAASLQVVPTITDVSVPSFTPGTTVMITGSGFVEGGTTVTFGQFAVEDPSLTAGPDVLEHNGLISLLLPHAAGSVVGVRTAGGSMIFPRPIGPTALTGIESVALVGVPTDPAQPSANTGQAMTITGQGFTVASSIVFPTVDDRGVQRLKAVSPQQVGPDGERLTVVVPSQAVTGEVRVEGVGGRVLQIVPTVSSATAPSFIPGATLTVTGSGFVTGETAVAMGGVTVEGDAAAGSPEIAGGGTRLSVVLPKGAQPRLTVTTKGGTSNMYVP